MTSYTDPAYNPETWSLGYQQRQFGRAADPDPSGVGPEIPGSIYSALANPPDSMTTAIELAIPDAPDITPTQ